MARVILLYNPRLRSFDSSLRIVGGLPLLVPARALRGYGLGPARTLSQSILKALSLKS